MDITTYAAGVSTLALVVSTATGTVQIVRWFTEGVKLKLSAMSEAKTFGGAMPDDRTYVNLTVTNRGTGSATLTHMILYSYPDRVSVFRNKPNFTGLVNTDQVPYVLKPGEVWMGQAAHTDKLRDLLKAGRLHVGVISSHRNKPYLVRLAARKRPEPS